MIWFRSATWWVGVVIILIAVAIMIESAPWSLEGKLFPWMIGVGVIITAGLHSLLGVVRGVKVEEMAAAREDDGTGAKKTGEDRPSGPSVYVISLWILSFLVLFTLVGHQLAIPLFIIAFMVSHGEKLLLAVIVSFCIWAFTAFILERVIHVVFPQPLMMQWLGI